MNIKLVVIIVALVAGLIGIGVLSGDPETTTTNATGSSNSQGPEVVTVELTEAGDFECPACASYHPIVKEVKEQYKDRVTFTFKHFPLTTIHPNALAAHRAAEAAAKQGKFWEMHDLLFEQRALWISQVTNNPVPQLESFAHDLGLDMVKFKEDFSSSEVNSTINTDSSAMKALGAESTPTFFLNGELIDNRELDTVEKLSAVLDQALVDAGLSNTSEPEASQ